MKWCEPEIGFIWLRYNLAGTLAILLWLFKMFWTKFVHKGKNELKVVRRGIKKLLAETVAYVFIDIPFLESHSPRFFKKWHWKSYLNMEELKQRLALGQRIE